MFAGSEISIGWDPAGNEGTIHFAKPGVHIRPTPRGKDGPLAQPHAQTPTHLPPQAHHHARAPPGAHSPAVPHECDQESHRPGSTAHNTLQRPETNPLPYPRGPLNPRAPLTPEKDPPPRDPLSHSPPSQHAIPHI